MKKTIRYILWIFLGLFIAFLLLPFIFKDKMIEAAKEQMNDYVNAEIDFDQVHLSIFKDFPLINLGFENLKISGVETFDSILLLDAQQFDFITDWKSMVRSRLGIEIIKINIENAHLNLLVNEQGQKNYDIWKTEDDKEGRMITGNINTYSFGDCKLTYEDQLSGMYMELNELDHSGSGKFEDIVFDISTSTHIGEFNLNYQGINYLHNADLEGNADILVDMNNNKYSIGENNFNLNNLNFSLTGDIEIEPESYVFKLDIKAPGNQVADVISIIPHVYSEDFDKIESTGIGSVTGSVKGLYNGNKGILPAIQFKALIKDGQMVSKENNARLEKMNAEANISASEGNWNDLVVNIPAFTFSIDNKPMTGKLYLSQIFGNTFYDLNLIGETDLNTIKEILQLNQFSSLQGKLESDFNFKGKQSDIDSKFYQNLDLDGELTMTGFDMIDSSDQRIKIEKFGMSLSSDHLDMQFTNALYKGSDFNGELKVKYPLLLIDSDSKATITLNTNTKVLDLDQLIGKNEDGNNTTAAGSTLPVDFKISFQAEKIIYEEYNLQNLSLDIRNEDERLIVNPSSLKLDDANLAFQGHLDEYYMGDKGLSGKIFLDSDHLNLNQYQGTESKQSSAASIEIPKDIDLEIHTEVNNIQYNQLTLKDTKAKIEISDGVANLTGGNAELFRGIVQFDGSFDSRDVQNPLFNFRYNLSDLKFAEMFQHSSTFRALAPIAEYIDGIFNSTLVISGPLDEDLLPNLYKISASGYMETLQGKIKGFKPLELMASSLGIDKLKEWDIKDSKNWFEVSEGIVQIKEHDYKLAGMTFKVAGSHALDQNIDYTIKAIIPRERLEKGKVGAELESSLNRIEKEAKNRGVDINLGDNIYFDIFITGSLTNPKVSIIPTGSGGESIDELVKAEIQTRVDELKEETTEKLESKTEEIKDTLSKAVEEKMDTLESKAKEKLDSATQVIKDKVIKGVESKIDSTQKGAIDSLSKKVGKEVEDIFGKKSQKEIDSIKSKIKDWNPFKKKKKEGG